MENCDQQKGEYKEQLLKSVTRLQEVEAKHKENVVQLRQKILQVERHVQQQFDKIRNQLTIFFEEDTTIGSGPTVSSGANVSITSFSEANSQSTTKSTSIPTTSISVPSTTYHECNKIVDQVTESLLKLSREERMTLTDKLLKQLKNMRSADKKAPIEDDSAETYDSNKEMKTATSISPQPSLIQRTQSSGSSMNNGEIRIDEQSKGAQLTATDSLITAQMLRDIADPATKSPTLENTVIASESTRTAASSSVLSTATAVMTSPKKSGAVPTVDVIKTPSNSTEIM